MAISSGENTSSLAMRDIRLSPLEDEDYAFGFQ